MIQYIPDTTPHILTLNEDNENMRNFIEEMTDIFLQYEIGNFQTPDGKLFKAELVTKTEISKTTRVTKQIAGKIFNVNVEHTRKVVFEYHFKEI